MTHQIATLTRRRLLASTAAIASLAACGSLTSANLAQVIADVKTIADGVAAALPTIGTINGISAGVVATVGTAVADVEKVAGAIAGVVSTAAATPLVSTLENGVSAVIGALSSVSLPSSVQTILADVSTLLPIVKSAVGMLVPAAPTASAVEIARARLKAAAAAGASR